MKSYDLVVIVRPDLDPDALKAVTDRITQRIKEQGGQVEAVNVWGKRRMTYVVRRSREGVYVHTRFTLDPRKVEEIRHQTALTEDVLRVVITNAVGKMPEPAAATPPPAPVAPVPPAPVTPAAPPSPADAPAET